MEVDRLGAYFLALGFGYVFLAFLWWVIITLLRYFGAIEWGGYFHCYTWGAWLPLILGGLILLALFVAKIQGGNQDYRRM